MIFVIPISSSGLGTFSLGIGYLTSILIKQHKEVKVINCCGVPKWRQLIDSWLSQNKNKFVGITTDASNIGCAISISKFIKNKYPDVKIIFGGPYATAIYKELIPKYADIVVLGEGEKTILDLADEKEPKDIKGIAYFSDGEIKVNAQGEVVENLDTLPFPIQVNEGNSIVRYTNSEFFCSYYWNARIITSRGCPYACINCTKIIQGDKIRLRSLDNVINEIEDLVKNQKAKRVEIYDENFTFYPDRVKALCKEIIKKNYNITLGLPNGIRADIGDREMFKLMRKAGFCEIALAVESGSEDVLNKLGKNLEMDKVQSTFKMAKQSGLVTYAFFMWGTPFDNKDTLNKTIEVAKKLNPDMSFFFMIRPFPGTKLYEHIIEHGKLLHNILENYPSYYINKMIYKLDGLNNKMIERMFVSAYIKFYFRVGYFFNLFKNNITSTRNIKSLFFIYQFIGHITRFFIKVQFINNFYRYMELIKKIIDKILNNPRIYFFIQKFFRDFSAEQNLIKNKIDIPCLNSVMDYGCGTGEFSKLFSVSQYVGMDINRNYLKLAKNVYKKNFLQTEKYRLPFKEKKFDLILLILILHHIPDDEIEILFQKLYKLLKDNGRIIILEVLPERFQNLIMKFLLFLEEKFRNIYIFEKTELKNILKHYFNIQEEYIAKLGIYCAQFYILAKK